MKRARFFLILLAFSCCTDNKELGCYSYISDTELGMCLSLELSKIDNDNVFEYNERGKRGKKITYIQGAQREVFFMEDGVNVIGAHVEEYRQNEFFIVVAQKPLDEIFGKIEIKNFTADRPLMPSNNTKVLRMLNTSTIFKYWILKKDCETIYGPLAIEEYKNLKRSLNVPDTLLLKSEISSP